jgi:nucleoside-diphosphate-sugar epimerase
LRRALGGAPSPLPVLWIPRYKKGHMRVLISGGAGFLASHLTDLLLEQGHDVVGVDNFITGKADNIRHLEGNARYKFIKHDVIEPLKIDGTIDRIYHMASPASPIGYVKHQIATVKVNSQGTWNLLNCRSRRRPAS